MRDRIFSLPRNVFVLGLTSLFNDFSSEMVFSVFPAFFVSVLRTGAASLGLVDGFAEAASNFFKIYSGHLSDRFERRKPLIALGYTLSVATRPVYALTGNVAGVLGLRFADRVGKGLRDSPRDALISLSSPRAELGRSFGYHRMMDTTGAILGPLVAYFLLRAYPARFDVVFVTSFFIGLAALASIAFIHDVGSAKNRSPRSNLRETFPVLPLRFKLILAAIFVLSIGTLPVAILLLKTTATGLAAVPLFYTLYNVSYAAFSISAGNASDRAGPIPVLIAGYIVLIAGYVVLTFADNTPLLVAGFALLGLFPALTDGVWRALASRLTAEQVRGGALGWVSGANGFGALIAGIAGGYLWQRYSPAAALLLAGCVVAAGLLMLLVTVGPLKPEKE